MKYKILIIAVIANMCAVAAVAQIKLANVLQDNMVVQQGKPLKVWGKGIPGRSIKIKADWNKLVTARCATDSTFSTTLQVPNAKAGDYGVHQISVSDGDSVVLLKNLQIGEVWLCGGQSNMAFKVKELLEAKNEIASADYSAIRFITVGFYWAGQPGNYFTGKWQVCSPTSVGEFSAIAYYFAKNLQQRLNVPIGIISSSAGGSSVQGWVPRQYLEKDQVLYNTYLKGFIESKRYREKIDGVFTWDRLASPYILYNAMINPFREVAVKGFLWYQGESNGKERESYTKATTALIKGWRAAFGQGNLPFYYVQIAPFNYDNQPDTANNYAFFREQQLLLRRLPNTGMVTTLDVGDANDIHPKNKKAVAERLSRLALNQTYNFKDITYISPIIRHVTYRGSSAIISFDPRSVKQGLSTRDGLPPTNFMLAGSDRIFYPATARLVDNEVILNSEKVAEPIAVRYAFTNYPSTNLQTTDNLPVEQFRTDKWPEKGPEYHFEFKPVLVNGEKP